MKTGITCLAAGLLAALLVGGCTKSDLPEPSSGYHRVRMYDDSLADARNRSIRIVAGNDRLLMTYGTTPDQLFFAIGSLVFPPPAKSAWLLTDNEGNLLRRDTLAPGLHIADAVALPDNSFLIASFTGIPNLSGDSSWWLFRTRVDPQGVMGRTDTLVVPGIVWPCQQLWDYRFTPIPNGNVFVSFGYGDLNYHYGNFIGEMDVQGNFLWYKLDQAYGVNDLVTTPDGGYLVVAGFWNAVTYVTEYSIMKTTSTFDSTWSRFIDMEHDPAGGVHIFPAGNGNYRVGYADTYGGSFNTHVLEINATGETVNSNSWQFTSNLDPYYLSTRMLQLGSSGAFISYSRSEVNVNDAASDQFNSTYVILDANLNVTQRAVIQNQSSDMLNSCCITSDGRVACFGIAQSYGRRYYKPMLILID